MYNNIKNIADIFLEENEKFEEEIAKSEKRLKLINDFSTDLPDLDFVGDFDLTIPMQPKSSKTVKVKMKKHKLDKHRKSNKNLF